MFLPMALLCSCTPEYRDFYRIFHICFCSVHQAATLSGEEMRLIGCDLTPEKSMLAFPPVILLFLGVYIDYFIICSGIFPRDGVGQAEGSLLGFLFLLFHSQGRVYSFCHHLLRDPH